VHLKENCKKVFFSHFHLLEYFTRSRNYFIVYVWILFSICRTQNTFFTFQLFFSLLIYSHVFTFVWYFISHFTIFSPPFSYTYFFCLLFCLLRTFKKDSVLLISFFLLYSTTKMYFAMYVIKYVQNNSLATSFFMSCPSKFTLQQKNMYAKNANREKKKLRRLKGKKCFLQSRKKC
jgi:hypothetical protein